MLAREVVDLCLSTDDEKTEPKAGTLDTNYRPLPEQIVNIDGGPRKKRKLNPPSKTNAEKLTKALTARSANLKSSLPSVKAGDYFYPIDDDDPIIWTSSPKQKPKAPIRPHHDLQSQVNLPDSDASLPDEEWLCAAQPKLAPGDKRVKQSTDLLFSSEKTHGRSHGSSDEGLSKVKNSKSEKARKPKYTEEEKAAQAREKEKAKAAAKASRLQKQEDLKERKRSSKEEQARAKQKEKDRAEANKLKLDKKLSTPEMVVDLPLSIDGSTVDTQTRECLKNIGVEITSYQSPVANVIKWRRKIDSRFNAETGAREKLQVQEIDAEKHVMCLMSANEFVQLATSDADDNSRNLDEHVSRIRRAFKDCRPIYLIEGLDVWIRKNRNAKNRAYQAAVRGQLEVNAPQNSSSGPHPVPRRKKPGVKVVDEDMLEDALLRLQVMNSCLVHHTAATLDTAEWVALFTEQISQIPYRHEQMARESTFCMDSGQVKCGKDAEETYINMLLANVRVTGPIAYGIAARHSNVVNLVDGLEGKGPTALEHLKKSANKDGSIGERNIGPAISRRLHKVFTDADPSSTDI
ncbi:MAG: hypothetical protein Q9209_004531 [Squamulea sp. 1 TL-2023]